MYLVMSDDISEILVIRMEKFNNRVVLFWLSRFFNISNLLFIYCIYKSAWSEFIYLLYDYRVT